MIAHGSWLVQAANNFGKFGAANGQKQESAQAGKHGCVNACMHACMHAWMHACIAYRVAYGIELHCSALHCIALHCIALPCLALPCLELPCLVFYCLYSHNTLTQEITGHILAQLLDSGACK